MEITNKPLREHYEDCNGQLAVFNYIDDLEKYIDYLVKLNLPVVSNQREMLIDFYTETCNKTINREYAEDIVDDYISN